jgi:hypothetical protein
MSPDEFDVAAFQAEMMAALDPTEVVRELDDIRAYAGIPEVREAIVRLLAAHPLRFPADALAEVFVGAHRSGLPPGQIVDLFLHGAI